MPRAAKKPRDRERCDEHLHIRLPASAALRLAILAAATGKDRAKVSREALLRGLAAIEGGEGEG